MVLHTTKVPARERTIPIASPSGPKNISKIGKPANEILPIPEVIMSTALVSLSIGFIKLTSSKKRIEKPYIIQGDNTNQICFLENSISGRYLKVKIGMKKLISSLLSFLPRPIGVTPYLLKSIPNTRNIKRNSVFSIRLKKWLPQEPLSTLNQT